MPTFIQNSSKFIDYFDWSSVSTISTLKTYSQAELHLHLPKPCWLFYFYYSINIITICLSTQEGLLRNYFLNSLHFIYLCILVFICVCVWRSETSHGFKFSPFKPLVCPGIILTLLLLCLMSHHIFSEWSSSSLSHHQYSPRPESMTSQSNPGRSKTVQMMSG